MALILASTDPFSAYMALGIYSHPYPGYEPSSGSSFAKVGRLVVENNREQNREQKRDNLSHKETLRHYVNCLHLFISLYCGPSSSAWLSSSIFEF